MRTAPGWITADREKALNFGAHDFVDLEQDALNDVGSVDLVFDLIGGEVQGQSSALVENGGTLVSVVGPVKHGRQRAWQL